MSNCWTSIEERFERSKSPITSFERIIPSTEARASKSSGAIPFEGRDRPQIHIQLLSTKQQLALILNNEGCDRGAYDHMPKAEGSMSMSPSFIILRICLLSLRFPPIPSSFSENVSLSNKFSNIFLFSHQSHVAIRCMRSALILAGSFFSMQSLNP